MKRREFIKAIGGFTVARPLALRAQQAPKVYRLGVLETISEAQNAGNLDALRDGLRNLGYREGQNLVIEYRSADGRAERFPELAAELVRLKVDLIVTKGTPAVQAAKEATKTIPIVMAATGAPLVVVDSLSHPGGNVTGLSAFDSDLIGKRVAFLKELVPSLSRLGLLENVGNPMTPPEWERAMATAGSLSLQAVLFDVRGESDLRRAFAAAVLQGVDGLLIGADAVTEVHRRLIVDLAASNRLPAGHPSRDFVEIGGLMAYGVDYANLYFRVAAFVDKIFKGASPAELPVEQPTRFELVINSKAASALGLAIPPSLLAQANDVID
jgi:putative tryptophan/tyrosine transport system substrate-binding protein